MDRRAIDSLSEWFATADRDPAKRATIDAATPILTVPVASFTTTVYPASADEKEMK